MAPRFSPGRSFLGARVQTYSPVCVALVEHFESLELEAYPDPASRLGRACAVRGLPMREYRKVGGWEDVDGSPWTIGWGRAGGGVKQGDVCTREEADQWRDGALAASCARVLEIFGPNLEQCELDALTSLYYNCADRKPTLESMMAMGLKSGAADQILRWDHAGGVEVQGLLRRRRAERLLFKGLLPDPLAPGFSWPDFSS